jgi:hypothetical protein
VQKSFNAYSQAETLYTIGTKDNGDAEFAQQDFALDFYPATQTAKSFAKELNLTWYPDQYLHFPLTQQAANQGITFHLDPAWNDGRGTLRVAVEVWAGKDWQMAGSTLLNMTEAGYVDVAPTFLRAGWNDLRLHAVSGTGGTTVVTWDQLKIQLTPFAPVWQLGNNDGSEAEFSKEDYALRHHIGVDPVSHFPKEINTNWYPDQYLNFSLSGAQAQKGALLFLDAFWNDGEGVMTVAAERWDGQRWIRLGSTDISRTQPGQLVIPAYSLKEGLNEWRLRAVSGSNETSIVMWDYLALIQRQAPPEAVALLLEEILDTTLNYFLSPKAITQSGLPLTALKVLERPRFGYSNPAEWGYALQTWLIAAERGLLTPDQACQKMVTALTTMQHLQNDPQQFKFGVFYPFYSLIDSEGNDVLMPTHTDNSKEDRELPSGDCALLWGSLNVAEGWLLEQGFWAAACQAQQVKAKLNFRAAYHVPNGVPRIAMTVNADTGAPRVHSWEIWADEGGPVNMICYLTESLTWEEFQAVLAAQQRPTRSWNGHTTRESAYFNAMFSWGQRSLLGFPMFGNGAERAYGMYSFLPNVAAHLDYGVELGIDYPGFSDAMSQHLNRIGLVGRYTPPNIPDKFDNDPHVPLHITPHALAIPFCALDALDETVLRRLFEKWLLLKCDTSDVWHPAFSQDPFGFEVIASPFLNQDKYPGVSDGRYVFETLSQAYTALSIYEGLQRYSDQRTFHYFAQQVPEFAPRVAEMLVAAYPND